MVLSHRTILTVILGISVTVLGGSLVMQLGFGLEPCILCLYQRLPYGAAAILAAVAFFLPAHWRHGVVAACGAGFGMNGALAFYHVGIENHWWEAAACLGDAGGTFSLAEMHAALERPVAVPCDVVQWTLFGLSLSGYNGLLSLGLAVFCLGVVRHDGGGFGMSDSLSPGLRRLPGDPPRQEMLARMLRVDQAGEYGAVRIYEGQMALLKHRECARTVREMAENEKTHLATFNKLLVERRVRPTALQPVWHVLGFALGAGTALLGERMAMVCTMAVEEVIEEHYAEQARTLDGAEPELREVILRYRDEELEHREIALAHGAAQHPASPLLSTAIKAGARLAIWLSERV